VGSLKTLLSLIVCPCLCIILCPCLCFTLCPPVPAATSNMSRRVSARLCASLCAAHASNIDQEEAHLVHVPSDRQTVRPSDRQTVRPSDRQAADVRPSDRQTVRPSDRQAVRPQTSDHQAVRPSDLSKVNIFIMTAASFLTVTYAGYFIDRLTCMKKFI
jgi:hypothetical protein